MGSNSLVVYHIRAAKCQEIECVKNGQGRFPQASLDAGLDRWDMDNADYSQVLK